MQTHPMVMRTVIRKFAGAAQRSTPCPPELPPAHSKWGAVVAALPSSNPDERNGRPPAGLVNPGARSIAGGIPSGRWSPGAAAFIALLFVLGSAWAPAAVREVGAIGLTVGDVDRELDFFTRILPFARVSVTTSTRGASDELLGLRGAETRTAELKLGEEHITLTQHLGTRSRPIPADSRSFDHWFQHIAIVVRDMDQAYEQLRRAKVKQVSTAPQTLPAWNKDAGGIKAFYFCDPENHVLEIIWFPPGKGDPKWQRPSTNLFLGIDHTAIVVSDTERSLAFYCDLLGMRRVGGAENYGVEQEHLNQVFGARLRISALRSERGPGIEFLEYMTPPGGRALPDDASATDLVFWHSRLITEGLDHLADVLRDARTRFVSTKVADLSRPGQPGPRSVIVRDPDGHALQFVESASDRGDRLLTSKGEPDGTSGVRKSEAR